MDLTGRLCEVSRDYITKKPMVKFLVNENLDGIEALEAKDLKIRVVKATNPRSLDANSYFHVLCDKLRQKLGISMAHMKFLKVGDDGAYWYKVYRGSHTYDTSEMHKLLEGTIYEAKEQGIETKTPDEIRRMEELWNQHSKQTSQGRN